MMIFSVAHEGQVNRMTYPALVPRISGFNIGFLIIILFGYSYGQHGTIVLTVHDTACKKGFARL